MGLHFSGTTPLYLPGWSNDQLPPSHMACAWTGAQLAFGSTWITTVPSPAPVLPPPTTAATSGPSSSISLTSQSQNSMTPTEQSDSTAQTSISSVPSVSFLAPTKLTSALKKPSRSTISRTTDSKLAACTPTPNRPHKCPPTIFPRSKSAPLPSAKRLKKAPTTKTYMNLQVPMRVSDVSEYFEQMTGAIKALHGAWTALMSVDSSHTTIEPWGAPEAKMPPIGSSSSFPKSKA
jgi:hypothetical protein